MGRDNAIYCEFVTLLVISLPLSSFAALIEGTILSQNIKTFTNKVGFNAIQDLYDRADFTTFDVNAQSLVTEISSSLESKFNGPINAARGIKEVIEKEEQNFLSQPYNPNCCSGQGVSYDSKFRSEVNVQETCFLQPQMSSPNNYPNRAIEEKMKDNARNYPNLKWQYFASEEGYYVNYPSVKLSDCSTYDPRFRPFYVETATPSAKDVVVILDRSGSMGDRHNGKTLLQIAKEATISVLETLNPNDRVGVVAFESSAVIVGVSGRSCLSSALARATPLNQKYLKDSINNLGLGLATNYEAAFTKAFDILTQTDAITTDMTREKVILFLTDGKLTEGGDPLVTIANRNKALGNHVIIFTYALGNAFSSDDVQLLKDIASQNKTDSSFGEVKPGEFVHIEDPSFLRSSMASYYSRFSSDEFMTSPVFSVPYQDLFGIGLITSVCLPVYKNNSDLFGVACSDITLADLMSDITYFRQEDLSYAFIIDGTGRTLMHPQLPQPSVVTDDPIFVHIDHLERSSSAKSVISEMIMGSTDQTTFTSKRTIPRGNALYEGIETRDIKSTYAWGPMPNSNFSIAIVVGFDDSLARLQDQTIQADMFHYHRLDVDTSSNTYCKHFYRYATTDFSTVMLTPGAFRDPINYLDSTETQYNITNYENYLGGYSSNNPGLKDSVINSVALTSEAEALWKSNEEQERLVVWRYIGTTDGVMRLYPGVQLPKNYDHTRRPWYIRTTALKGKIVFSAPYIDQWSGGYIITVATTITENGTSGPIVGVTGTDFRVPYMYQLLLNSYDACSQPTYSCFVVDSSGMIVVHIDFIEFDGYKPQVENMHITTKEPVIAEDLLKSNIMDKASCLDFEDIKKRFSYRITTSNYVSRTNSYVHYEIHPVSDTNIFVVVKRNVQASSMQSCCNSYGINPNEKQCNGILCDCLCYVPADFNYCLNRFTLLSDAAPTCSPQPQVLETNTLRETERVRYLDVCFDAQCSTRTTKGECRSVSGCNWCYRYNTTNRNLTQPFCGTIYQCPLGIVSETPPCIGDSCPEKETGSNGGMIAGIIIGLLVLVGLIVAGIFIWKKRKADTAENSMQSPSTSKTSTSSASSTASPEQHAIYNEIRLSEGPSTYHEIAGHENSEHQNIEYDEPVSGGSNKYSYACGHQNGGYLEPASGGTDGYSYASGHQNGGYLEPASGGTDGYSYASEHQNSGYLEPVNGGSIEYSYVRK